MIARMLTAPCQGRRIVLTWLLLGLISGCAGTGQKHEARHIPDRGFIDPDQARELDKTTMPRYVVEPPDELDVMIKPAPPDWNLNNVTVQQDGVIDLGFLGDVYVVGLTLEQIEQRIAQQLTQIANQKGQKLEEPYRVSVRLANSQSKFYYVMGTVQNQGRFPIKGGDTVLDAIIQAGLKSNSLPEKAFLVRPHRPGECDQVLKIDWCGIRERGDTLTNYQLFPGDRVIVPGTRPPSLIATLLGR
ncbi:MAG: polysaccharide biosynthesis/export family protein [Isosphaeraceae bacterium]